MAGKLTDRELRRQALKLKDPYEQPALTWEIPKEVGLIDILNIYIFERWPREKVLCVKCGGHRHKHGFTAVLSNGLRVLLGSSCGRELFGESWVHAERRMKERSDRQWELDRLERLEPIVDLMRDALLTWESRVDRMLALKSGFFRMLGELASRVQEATNVHGGKLTVNRQVDMKTQSYGQSTAPVHVDVPVGDLVGADLFLDFDAAGVIRQSVGAIDEVKEAFWGTDAVPTGLLRRRRLAFERTFGGLETAARIYRGGQEFFTPASFANLVNWTDRYTVTRARYDWTGDGITYDDGRPGINLPVEPFKDLPEEPLDLIQEYRRAD
jgi:hypothetical protein